MATSLIPNDPPWLTLPGASRHPGPHTLDLYQMGGQLYLKVTVNGRNPGGGEPELDLLLTLDQADQLMQGLASGLRRLGQTQVSV